MEKFVKLRDIKDTLIDLNRKVFLEKKTAKPIMEAIVALPTIDIVYCVECRYKDMELCSMSKMRNAGVLYPYDFCSHGERIDNE